MMGSAKFKVSREQFWSVSDPILLSFSPSSSFSSHSAAAAENLLQFLPHFSSALGCGSLVLFVVGGGGGGGGVMCALVLVSCSE
jgi:hypothetical protein